MDENGRYLLQLRGVFEKQWDWVYKCFILFDKKILQHVACKVISLGLECTFSISSAMLPRTPGRITPGSLEAFS